MSVGDQDADGFPVRVFPRYEIESLGVIAGFLLVVQRKGFRAAPDLLSEAEPFYLEVVRQIPGEPVDVVLGFLGETGRDESEAVIVFLVPVTGVERGPHGTGIVHGDVAYRLLDEFLFPFGQGGHQENAKQKDGQETDGPD